MVTTQQHDTDALQRLIEQARVVTQPHVDIPFGNATVRVQATELQNLLHGAPPGVELHLDNTTLTVKRQDGGVMGTLTIQW